MGAVSSVVTDSNVPWYLSASTLAVATAAAYASLRTFVAYVRWRTSPLRRIPHGPRNSTFFVGELRTILGEPFMAPHKRWIAEAGPDAPLISFSQLFGTWTVMLLDADIVKRVLTEPASREPRRYTKGILGPVMTETLGNGLVTLEGTDWSRHRRIIQPAFQTHLLRERLGECVPRRTMAVVEAWREAGPGRSIDLASHMSALTLDVIGDVAFSHEFGGVELVREWAGRPRARGTKDDDDDGDGDDEELAEVDDPLIRALSVVFKPNFRVIFAAVFRLYYLNWILNPKSRQTRALLNEAVDAIIRNAREKKRRRATETAPIEEEGKESSSAPECTPTPAPATPSGGPKGKSLLELLFDAEDADGGGRNSLSHAELRAECNTFILAGHETTSTWCYWALYALSKHPDVQEKVHAEISAAVDPAEEVLNLDATENLEYFDAFLKEVLRMYPPAGMIFRRTTMDMELGGYLISPSTRCMIPIHILHRHPRYWDDPLTFKPERWMGSKEPAKHRFAYLPFSHGPRNCVGQKFAVMEAKLIIANLVRNFRFELAPECRDKEITFTTTLTVKAKPAIKVSAKPR